MLAFISANEASIKQLRLTPGFVCGKELMDKGFTFWTLTIWEKDADMNRFRNSEPHRKAMQHLSGWCNEATYVHWLQDELLLPDWNHVYERMINEGIVTKVRNPSARHLYKSFPVIKWTRTERKYKPAA